MSLHFLWCHLTWDVTLSNRLGLINTVNTIPKFRKLFFIKETSTNYSKPTTIIDYLLMPRQHVLMKVGFKCTYLHAFSKKTWTSIVRDNMFLEYMCTGKFERDKTQDDRMWIFRHKSQSPRCSGFLVIGPSWPQRSGTHSSELEWRRTKRTCLGLFL